MINIHEKTLHRYANILLGIFFFYLIGPTFRLLNAYISDYLFLLFALHVFFGPLKIKFSFKESKIFLIPFVVIMLVTIGKFFTGSELFIDEFANNINYLKMFLMFCFTYSIIIQIKDVNFLDRYLKNIFRLLAIGVIFVSMISIMQFLNFKFVDLIIENFYLIQHKTANSTNIDQFNETNRVVGIFDSYNGCGFFMCFFTFILIMVFSEMRSKTTILAIMLGFITLVLTSNRASLITFLIMNAIFFIFIKRITNLKVIFSVTFMLLLFLYLGTYVSDFISLGNFNRFLEVKDFIDKGQVPFTFADRTNAWEWMPQYVLSSKYAIFGFTNSGFLNDLNFRSPDNQYLTWFVNYGIIGAVGLMVWTIYSFVKLINLYRDEKFTRTESLITIAGGFIVIWIGLSIEGISQDSFFGNRWREYFVFIIAVFAALKFYRPTMKFNTQGS